MQTIKIPILMYHSISSVPKGTVMRSLHVHPRNFKLQMWILKVLGYKALSLKNLRPYLESQKIGKVVGITFDDGYQNNLIHAAPILRKYDFSATCFIVSSKVGGSNSWDIAKGIPQIPLMNEDEINLWLKFGMDIGAHTKNHVDLTEVSLDYAKSEIRDCKSELEKMFKIKVTDFCYPFGRFNDSILNLVRESGYYSASSMQRGRLSSASNKLLLPRIPVNYLTMPHLFLAKILTKYEDRR